jgi:hypothetical protein
MIVCSVVGVIVFSITIPTVDTIRANGQSAQWIVDHLRSRRHFSGSVCNISVGGDSWSGTLETAGVLLGIVSTVTARAFDSSALILTAVFGWPIYYFNLPKIKALFERPKA